MTPTRHPLIELVYDDPTGRYIGMLERKLVVMTLEHTRFRALLELLTGDVWDDKPFTAEDKEIWDIAIQALMQRLQLSQEDARKLVAERWEATSPPEPDPSLATYMVGMPKAEPPLVVSHARRISPDQTAPFDHKKHLQGLEKANARKAARKQARAESGGIS